MVRKVLINATYGMDVRHIAVASYYGLATCS